MASKDAASNKSTKSAKKFNGTSTGSAVKGQSLFNMLGKDWQILGALLAVAMAVRLYKLSQPSSVVFDEVHFGGFARKYINGKFFMDVHPPLAKLLFALVGYLGGYDGEFDFKEIGKDYLSAGVPYVTMRLYPALLGVAVVPLIFLTLKASGCATTTAVLGAGFTIFENGLMTQSRHILLDSPLIFCTALTSFMWTMFERQQANAFSGRWWTFLAGTGLALGLTASIKWVGLFTIAWIGALTVHQLWSLLGDLSVSPRKWFNHLFARAICLIGIPVGFYMFMFAIHFACLTNSGDGDAFMSPEFQQTINGKAAPATAADVAFGSKVAIRHWNTNGGYLHSHPHAYPDGSKQQQITLYPHRDDNNVWEIHNETEIVLPDGSAPIYLEDKMVIKLRHILTDKRLHSHDVKAPVSEADWQHEVSAYGFPGFAGDANDFFRVEIQKDLSHGDLAKKRVRAIDTKFRLIHIMTGCALFSHKQKLPDWGFEQQEVTCAKQGTKPNSIWYIESNENPHLGPDAETVSYRKPGFLAKFWELQKVMWTTNAGLVESHNWDSRPTSWPILKRGINFWGKDHRQVYLIGNPLVWYSTTAAILLYIAFKGLITLRWQRGYTDYQYEAVRHYDWSVGTNVLGWALHYLPFFLMARQLFLHHYFPALYFGILTLCQGWDFFTKKFLGNAQARSAATILALLASAYVFSIYMPLSYGGPWTKAQCEKSKLMKTWDFDCSTFHDNISMYLGESSSQVSVKGPVPTSTSVPSTQRQDPQVPVEQKPLAVPPVAQQPQQPSGQSPPAVVSKVEYRDQFGNILNDEQVEALKKQENVIFETSYKTETKTRGQDQYGRVYEGEEFERIKELERMHAEQVATGGDPSKLTFVETVQSSASESEQSERKSRETKVVTETKKVTKTLTESSVHTETVIETEEIPEMHTETVSRTVVQDGEPEGVRGTLAEAQNPLTAEAENMPEGENTEPHEAKMAMGGMDRQVDHSNNPEPVEGSGVPAAEETA
ncbi:Dolichyl-phosphate-mannose--protein mannosyltransferase 1 [Saitoella coloradoensis]